MQNEKRNHDEKLPAHANKSLLFKYIWDLGASFHMIINKTYCVQLLLKDKWTQKQIWWIFYKCLPFFMQIK